MKRQWRDTLPLILMPPIRTYTAHAGAPLMAKKAAKKSARPVTAANKAESYQHPESTLPNRPEVGTQTQFKKKKPAQKFRYDSSLSPALEWDGQNSAREQGEAAVADVLAQAAAVRQAALDAQQRAADVVETFRGDLLDRPALKAIQTAAKQAVDAAAGIEAAAAKLKALSRPFLNWAGKAERLSFDVPTLPLFVHERLSTQAIIETLTGHRRQKETQLELFADPDRPITDQVLRPYEYPEKWVNRMILGDSLVVMNSLLQYESLGGQVQMIYMDPPYGVKFGSNFQPFVRKREVKHNDDDDLTREPEMVQAYRDTWNVGLHSYLTALRDRLYVAKDLLHPSGSIFLQISDDNFHYVREVMDEVFDERNFAGVICFAKTSSQSTVSIPSLVDYVICYARSREHQKLKQLLRRKQPGERGAKQYTLIASPDLKNVRRMTEEELSGTRPLPEAWKVCALGPLTSQGFQKERSGAYKFDGGTYFPPPNRHWSYDPSPGGEMDRLVGLNRIRRSGDSIRSILLAEDNPTTVLDNVWLDTGVGSFTEEYIYVVQTNPKVVERCVLMTTDPGDLVLDPTCGSGTSAYAAEKWGRRWITADVSRVPLALARQRLLTATFDWYELNDDSRGPVSGFTFRRRQTDRGDEVGGIVPHVTLKNIANKEPPAEEVLVDRPEIISGITRVSGPFTFEATIPTPIDFDGDGQEDSGMPPDERQSFTDRLLEVLRRSPLLRLEGNRTVQLARIRPPAKSLSLSAEAVVVNGTEKPVAFVFGPENGSISENLVYQAAREAHAKSYSQLFVLGFAIQPNARALVETCDRVIGVPATYVQATPDLLMGDLLKNMRSSQIFSVCGLPEIRISKVKKNGKKGEQKYQVELLGLDVFDPITMEAEHRPGDDVPAWFLDVDYNDRCFHISQAFFPRTSAWDSLKKALKGTHDENVWQHLAGTTSAPFEAGDHGKIAVKVIDDRGNELVAVKPLP